VTRSASRPLECRLSKYEREELGWTEVSYCSKCDHAVFLAETLADASALALLGQCVKFTREYVPEPLFIGLWTWDPARDRQVSLRIALPCASASTRKKALQGATLYLNRMPEFDLLVARLTQGEGVHTPLMAQNEARALEVRLAEWGLVVSYAA
jgi:hypothetical protein